ncbi:MAG: DUF7521 family protein [Halobacteriota archaeon]
MSPDVLGTDITTITFVSIVKTTILLVGGFVSVTAYRAYRRTGDGALAYLSVGFGLITLGTFLAGAVYHLGLTLAQGILIESFLVVIGFIVIAYSMYHRRG